MSKTRNNHYVPQWYQKGFLSETSKKLHYLDLNPAKEQLPDGRVITKNSYKLNSVSQCFCKKDLYTTFFGDYINDEIEKKLFGEIDNTGSKAVRAFIGEDISEWNKHFSNFFSYIDSQKIRTPKGLEWIKSHYPELDQLHLMVEMQAIRNRHCTIWSESVREIISAKNSSVKFIISDHPVTIYNHALLPESEQCTFPNDPPITLKGTQTIFPLDKDHCLVFTNIEYAKNPKTENPTEKRTHARYNRSSMVRTDTFIKSRFLNNEDVEKINLIIKTRAHRYIAAATKDWLYPERSINLGWEKLQEVLLPPKDELWHFGGEIYIGHSDGTSSYQDAFGRTTPANEHLKKPRREEPLQPDDYCGCGYGKIYKDCCMNKSEAERPSWKELSIRERNIIFFNTVMDILGLSENKTWEDVRRELSNEQVKKIHEFYGFLWPTETDIVSLLSKPDQNVRALYTGVVDPRVISEFAISSTLYFDEVIIQNPFPNPNCLSPEFNPVKNPHQYKLQTLKNIQLLTILIPFIEEGYINFIPDPCNFDGHLQRQMLNMAEERSQNLQISEKDKPLFDWIKKDDFERTMGLLSKDKIKIQIRRALPDSSESIIEETFRHMETKKQGDPLALLQENVYEEGEQLIGIHINPNFEVSMFLCQATGSFLLTDNHTRWEEIKEAQFKENEAVVYNWSGLTNHINVFKYILNGNSETTFQLRKSGKIGGFRKTMKEMYSAIQGKEEPSEIDPSIKKLKQQFIKSHELAKKETEEIEQDKFNGKINCLIPKGGIVHNNVQRLLLSCGVDNHLKSVPMALFVEHDRSTNV